VIGTAAQHRGERRDADALLLPLPFPIDLRLTVASHGWVHLAPWHWDPDHGVLSRCERICDEFGLVEVWQIEPAALAIRSDGFNSASAAEVVRRVRRWVSAEWDPSPAITSLGADGALIERGGGRLLRGSSFYEDFVKTVLTINTAWRATCRMAAALVAEPGGGAFPVPEAIVDYGEARLRERAKLGFRAATLYRATQRMFDDRVIDSDGEGRPEYDYLIGLSGIGPYAAAHCRLLLHDFSRLPVDSVLVAYLRQCHDTDPAGFAASRVDWGDHLALGYRLMRLREKLEAATAPKTERDISSRLE
jgi:3-methyladenine DNA glycosylase/8-oxoguanine DNA glycosylase